MKIPGFNPPLAKGFTKNTFPLLVGAHQSSPTTFFRNSLSSLVVIFPTIPSTPIPRKDWIYPLELGLNNGSINYVLGIFGLLLLSLVQIYHQFHALEAMYH